MEKYFTSESCTYRIGYFIAVLLASLITRVTSTDPQLYNISRSWVFEGNLNTTTFQVGYSNLDRLNVQKIYFFNDRCVCGFNTTIYNMTGSAITLIPDLISGIPATKLHPKFTYNLTIEHSTSSTGIPTQTLVSPTKKLVSNLTLEVVEDPFVVDVCPEVIFATGGIKLTITGRELVKAGQANLVVKIQLQDQDGMSIPQVVTRQSQVCEPRQSQLICTVPLLNIQKLMEDYSPSASTGSPSTNRSSNLTRRDIPSGRTRRIKRSTSKTLTKNGKKADVSIVLNFSGFSTPVDLTTMVRFDLTKPTFSLSSSSDLFFYKPESGESLKINGENILLGCTKDDYHIELGAAKCELADVADNLLTCLPPKVKPQPAANSSKLCQDKNGALALVVQLGSYSDDSTIFFIRCIDYDSFNLALALGLGLGLGLFFLLLVVGSILLGIFCCFRKSRRKAKNQAWDHNLSVVSVFREKSESFKKANILPAILHAANKVSEENTNTKIPDGYDSYIRSDNSDSDQVDGKGPPSYLPIIPDSNETIDQSKHETDSGTQKDENTFPSQRQMQMGEVAEIGSYNYFDHNDDGQGRASKSSQKLDKNYNKAAENDGAQNPLFKPSGNGGTGKSYLGMSNSGGQKMV